MLIPYHNDYRFKVKVTPGNNKKGKGKKKKERKNCTQWLILYTLLY